MINNNKIIFLALFCFLIGCNSKEKKSQSKGVTPNPESISFAKMTLHNPKIQAAIEEFIKFDSVCYKSGPKVYQVFIENYYLELSFKITPIIYYSNLVERLPSGYTVIDNKVVVFYTGLERLAHLDPNWIKSLKTVIGDDLENDLLENNTIDTSYQTVLYHPPTWEVRLRGDSVIIDKHAPYPEIIPLPPIHKMMKFFPPKKKRRS